MDGDPFAPGLLTRLQPAPRKIVVLRASRIGDFICATPAFRALRQGLRDAEIHLITLPMLLELAQRLPYFDRLIPFPGYPGIAEQLFVPGKTASFFQEMQSNEYDLAIQLQGSGIYSNPFTLMLGARYTAGFIRPSDSSGRLDAALEMPQTGHEVQRVLSLIQYLGLPSKGEHIEFPLYNEELQAADELLADARQPLIGLHPAARSATRRWDIDRFAQIGARLQAHTGGTLVAIGEEEDCPLVERMLSTGKGRCINLAGRTSLPVLGAVISRLSLLITNDSGPAHIAYALGTPTVTIFGGADPERYGPPLSESNKKLVHPVPCRPCEVIECPIGNLCLKQISVEQVLNAALDLIKIRN